MQDLTPQEHPTILWFRALPKWLQWVYGLPVLLAGVHYLINPPAPEPGVQQASFLASLVIAIVLLVATELLRPKQNFEDARPAGLGDFKFPTATEGRVIPIVWGRVLAEGPNVVWYGALEQVAITESLKTGLWSSQRVTKGHRYNVGVQIALCRGEVESVRRMLIGDKEVASGNFTTSFDVDEPELFGGDDLGTGGFQATFDIFRGTDTQAVSDYLAQHQDAGAGTNRTPRYTGTCYLVARELGATAATAAGAYVGNSTSIKPWKFEIDRYPPLWTGQTSGQNKIGVDANPINVLYEILTNTEWGFGFPEADIDLTNFQDASAVVRGASELLGFSMLLDRPLQAVELLEEVERHVDGIVFLDHSTGKWKIKLARDDYDIDLVPQINADNIKAVKNFTNGTWEETLNQIDVKFHHRDNAYKETYATAQDSANYQTQGGGTISTGQSIAGQVFYPGCKDPDLANFLAWRELRSKSIPLARATFVVTREFWNLTVGSVVAWTDTKYGFTKQPMRIAKIDFGRLDKNEIEINCVQDVFNTQAPSFGAPPTTGWVEPEATLVAYPVDEQLAFEAPRAILVRDPNYEGSEVISKVMCSARRQGLEAAIQMTQRNHPTTPTGSYSNSGLVVQFMRIGKLNSSLSAGVASPTSTISVQADPDTKERIEAEFDDSATIADIGSNLRHLIMVNDEFMLVDSASLSGADVLLNSVYRGALDSAQGAHAASDEVYLLFAGSGLTDDTFPNTQRVDIELRSRTASGTTFAGAVTTFNLTMAKRALRPYPPAAALFNSSGTPWGTPSLEGSGSTAADYGVDVDWWRRNFQNSDEIQALLSDDSSTDSSTEYQLEVRYDPAGSNLLVGALSSWTTGTGTLNVQRNDIIAQGTLGGSPTIRFILRSRHDYLTETNLPSRNELIYDVTPTSALSGDFYMGSPATNSPTNSYTALATGTYTVNIGAVMSSGIQYRINGGTWTALSGYTSGVSTSGTIPGVTATDTIEVRRTTNTTPNPNYVELVNPSATRVGYGVFHN